MIKIREKPDVIEFDVSGTLTGDDYDRLVPELERLAAERGPLRMYIELHDFHGWTPAGLWKDLRFDATHQDDLERIAVVGERRLEEWATKLSQPLLKADMRFFPPEESDAARRWVAGDPSGAD